MNITKVHPLFVHKLVKTIAPIMATMLPKPVETQMYVRLRTAIDLLAAQMTNFHQMQELDDYWPTIRELRAHEKRVLYDMYKEGEWNVGAGFVYECLQATSILSISSYVYNVATRHERRSAAASDSDGGSSTEQRLHDDQLIETVLNEVLDSFPMLLLELIISNLKCAHERSQLIAERLDAAVGRLVVDVHRMAAVPSFNCYFTALSSAPVPAEKMDVFRMMHLRHIIRLDATPTRLAIGRMAKWLEYNPYVDRVQLWQMMRHAVGPPTTGSCLRLLACVQHSEFSGWCWWLYLWSALVGNPAVSEETFTAIRSKLKEMLRRFVQTQNAQLLYQVLIVARGTAVYAPDHRRFGAYGTWFERTLGNAAYVQTPDEFRLIVETLTAMVADECDPMALQAHLMVHMAAPPHCNELVQLWRKSTRSRLAVLRRAEDDDAATSAPATGAAPAKAASQMWTDLEEEDEMDRTADEVTVQSY